MNEPSFSARYADVAERPYAIQLSNAISGRTPVRWYGADDLDEARAIAAIVYWNNTRAEITIPLTGTQVPRVAPAEPHACGISCTGAALGSECRCQCGGRMHAVLHLPPVERPGYVPSAPRDPFARLPVLDDEPW